MGLPHTDGWFARLLAALNPWGALARAEADARITEGRLREALDALPTGVVVLDSELRYVLWNKAYGEIYHRSSDLFRVGRPLSETLRIGVERGDYPAAIGREEAWLAERIALLRHPSGARLEQQLRDGRWVMIEERRTADGGVIGLRVDITEMKAQAAALRVALSRAEAGSRAKAEFLANMSHELKTPLNGVIGLAEVLFRSPLSAPQKSLVGEMLVSGRRLHVLLDDVLNFNALESGQTQLAASRFSPAETARLATESLRAAAQANGVSLTMVLGPGTEARVVADPDKLGQVLGHLLNNAVKFTAAGAVTLTVGRGDGDDWRFEVTDTGAGLDPAETERMFAGFEMGDGSATREHGGAGLGLAICQRLAGLMGGRIELVSEPGKGSTFTVAVPLCPDVAPGTGGP